MNELYAVEPSILKSSRDLQFILRSFSPFAGQYLAIYPKNWIEQVINEFKNKLKLGEINDHEMQRISRLLATAKEKHSIIECPHLVERYGRTWLENVKELMNRTPPTFTKIVAKEASPPDNNSLDDFDPPKNAGCRFLSSPDEYARICKTLISISAEIAIFDPYINPTKKKYKKVLTEILKTASLSKKCERIILWTKSELLENTPKMKQDDLNSAKHIFQIALNDIAQSARLSKCRIVVNFVIRNDRNDAFHSRGILSIKGGIFFDQGFAELRDGTQRNYAAPMGEELHKNYYAMYFQGENDFELDKNPIEIYI